MKVHFSTCLAILLACGLLFAMSGMAQAFPSAAVGEGNSCSSCHANADDNGAPRPGAMQVNGEGLLNLDPLRNDGNVRGEIPFFTVFPGDTVTLTMQVNDGSDKYAVQLKRFEKEGILGPLGAGDTLAGYTPDGTWTPQGPLPSTYYTDTGSSNTWTSGPVVKTFQLLVPLNTPRNSYDLEYAVAGRLDDATRAKFYDDQHFYVNVIPEPTSLVLVGLGLSVLGLVICRRKAAA